jgi:DNA-binding response OmpR family regulator
MVTQILVVDDEEAIRELLISFLQEHGYETAGAEDGEQGLEMARRLKPRVILLDVAMPRMDGIEALRALRQEVPQATVIMLSGHADHDTALRALELGAHDFIEKPFDLAYLEKVLIVKLALSR